MKFFMAKNTDEGHRVIINIPKKIINSSLQEEFIKISKTHNVNGFRKGKIPIKFIQKKYGDSVYYDIFPQLMQKFFYKFINQEKITIIGCPKYYIHENKDKNQEYFEYSVIYEIYPKFDMQSIKKIKVNKIDVKITDEDVKTSIIKNQFTKLFWKPVNRPIKYNDRITIDYYIYDNNKLLSQFNKKNFMFDLSDNTLIPQIKHKIMHHIVNDIIFFKIKFHSLHPEKLLQNKNIIFKIKIIKIEEPEEIEVNQKNINNTINSLNKKNYINIKNQITAEIQKITEKYIEDQIIEKIIKNQIILIPPVLFQQKQKNLYEQYVKQYQKENANILEKKYHYIIDIQVKKTLCMEIILNTIISDHQIFLDEKNIQSLITKMPENYQKTKKMMALYHKNEKFKHIINNIALKHQAMVLLKNNVKHVRKSFTFKDFINYKWPIYEDLNLYEV